VVLSEAETTINKRLQRSTFCIEAIAYKHEASRGLFATAELIRSAELGRSVLI